MNSLTNINKVLPVKEKRVPFGTLVWIGERENIYMLVQPAYRTMSLTSLRDGNRWEELSTCVTFETKDYNQTISEANLDAIIRLHNKCCEWGYVRSVKVEVNNE